MNMKNRERVLYLSLFLRLLTELAVSMFRQKNYLE